MEKERQRAQQHGDESPIFDTKEEVDLNYHAAIDFCMQNRDVVATCFATHNLESCLHGARKLNEKQRSINDEFAFFAQLYGMGDVLTANLAKNGYEAVKLIPYGPIHEAIPYLIRRAEENSSVAGQVSRELKCLDKEIQRRERN